MKIIECQQGSREWLEARRGLATASRFDKIITPKTGKLSASADELICELLGEKLSGEPVTNGHVSRAGERGLQLEAEARGWYELQTNCDVHQVGLCISDCGRFGFSPDGLLKNKHGNYYGGLEIKCHEPKALIRYLLKGGFAEDHRPQAHGPLAIEPALEFWDLISYCPWNASKSTIVHVTRDAYTEKLKDALEMFWKRYQDLLAQIEDRPLTETLKAAIAEVTGGAT